MSLRKRLMLALFGSGLVIVTVAALARGLIVSRAAEAELRSGLEARVDAIGRERCEQGLLPGPPRGPRGLGPGTGRPPGSEPPPGAPPPGPRRRPIEVHFFAEDYRPRMEEGPPFPDTAREALAGGASFVAVAGREGGLIGALATGWSSPRCAYAVGFMPMPPPLLPWTSLALASLAFLGALAGALHIAAASPVRRIRALAENMRVAAVNRYEQGVRIEGKDEIAGLAGAFNDAAATVRAHLVEVETRERALRDFVANTTHDVGLPLSVLAGNLTDMRGHVTPGNAMEPLLDAATRETHYIASLLHNLDAVARLETEDALRDARPVDLVALVERVVLRHASLARGARVELNHAVPEQAVPVLGDVTLLEQAVNNLVHNAVRYNRPGGHVAVVLDADGQRFELRVTDDGPGVSDEDLPHLGEARFRAGDARSRRPEGTGLGLSIARDVATRHGLSLDLRRPKGGGFEAILSGPRSQ